MSCGGFSLIALRILALLAGHQARGVEMEVWPAGGVLPEDSTWTANSVPILLVNDTHYASCDACCESDCCCCSNWWDNTEVFLGGDAYAALGDSPAGGFGNSFGLVTGFNSGFGLGDSQIRGQFGMSYGVYDFKGRIVEPDSLEEQIFATTGIYRRADWCSGERITWGLVIDGFFTDNWGFGASEFNLAQLRGIAGYAINECNEVGLWATMAITEDTTPIPDGARRLCEP